MADAARMRSRSERVRRLVVTAAAGGITFRRAEPHRSKTDDNSTARTKTKKWTSDSLDDEDSGGDSGRTVIATVGVGAASSRCGLIRRSVNEGQTLSLCGSVGRLGVAC